MRGRGPWPRALPARGFLDARGDYPQWAAYTLWKSNLHHMKRPSASQRGAICTVRGSCKVRRTFRSSLKGSCDSVRIITIMRTIVYSGHRLGYSEVAVAFDAGRRASTRNRTVDTGQEPSEVCEVVNVEALVRPHVHTIAKRPRSVAVIFSFTPTGAGA